MKIKVSNVCQILDQSKASASHTDLGITYVNNGDGSFTINGTSTSQYYSRLTILIDVSLLKPGHKIVVTDVKSPMNVAELFVADYTGGYISANKDSIYTVPQHEGYKGFRYEIRVYKDKTATDAVVIPQFFDLTEMYGLGNEPTTVAQFRQDFPEEYYEYYPECWKKCKELRYVVETNNLFVSSIKTGDAGAFSNATIRNFEENVWYIGLTRNNYNEAKNISTYEIKYNYLKVVTKNPGYGIVRAFRVSSNTQYTLSFKGSNVMGIGFGFYDNTGKYLSMIDSIFTVTTPENCAWITVVFGTYPTNTENYYTDIQLEKGSVATPYKPYGYLPLRIGKYIANKEPVQLLDKSDFKTAVSKGVTATPNTTNGMWTISGAATASEYLAIGSYHLGTNFDIGDKLFLRHSNIDNSVYFPFAAWYDKDNKYLGEYDGAGIFSVTNPKTAYIACFFATRTVGDINVTTQVQLFNLTRMYGKGNEPTAAEFVAQYPGFDYPVNKYNAITFR